MADRYPDLRRAAARCLVLAVFAALSAFAGSASASWIVFDCHPRLCRVPAAGGPVQTFGPSGAEWPALSPDGRHLAYAYGDGVYLADADGSNSRLVEQPQGDVTSVVWRRDSRAFLWNRGISGLPDVVCRLVLGQTPECSNFTGRDATWGPSDHRLLRTDPDTGKTICVATLTGRCRRTVAVTDRYFSWGSALSPNGDLVAVAENVSDYEEGIALYDQRTARRVRWVARGGYEMSYPAWSPGGGKLVFQRRVVEPITGAPTRYDICRVRVEGGPVRCLARGPYYVPSWGL